MAKEEPIYQGILMLFRLPIPPSALYTYDGGDLQQQETLPKMQNRVTAQHIITVQLPLSFEFPI